MTTTTDRGDRPRVARSFTIRKDTKMKKKQTFRIWVCGDRYKVARHFEGSMNNVSDLPALEWADMFIESIEENLCFQIKSGIEKSELKYISIICVVDEDTEEYHNHLWSCSKIVPSELKKIVNDAIDWQLNMLQEVMDVTKIEQIKKGQENG
tara:strand:+ start:562 stop:1017 length:456 start_codon:yes stop_codon:yes gene_type:complete